MTLREDGSSAGIDTMSVVRAAFAPLGGRRLLDVGCGKGHLARALAEGGARVVGVDPNVEVLEVARRNVPSGTFCRAGTEAMPFADRSFDGGIFLNSLHHVPRPAMGRALGEAARVVRPEGPIVVVEPLAEGSLFSVLRQVEDETETRAAAQEAIDAMVESGAFEPIRRVDYLRHERYADFDRFVVQTVAVDPARAAIVEARCSEVEAAFRREARAAADGSMILEQPMLARILTARA